MLLCGCAESFTSLRPCAFDQRQKQAIETSHAGVVDLHTSLVQHLLYLGELSVFSVALDADQGDHIQAVGAVGWTDLQVSTRMEVAAIGGTLWILTDSTVGHYMVLSVERLYRFVRVCATVH